jgi:hypothetical protein
MMKRAIFVRPPLQLGPRMLEGKIDGPTSKVEDEFVHSAPVGAAGRL